MLELDLIEAIKRFVKTFYVVRRRHLDRFFADWDRGNYEYAMFQLLSSETLYELEGGLLSLFRPDKIHTSLANYNSMLRCLDMMTSAVTSTEVKWYGSVGFPMDIRFLTIADEIYDVTYLDGSNWMHRYALLPTAWRDCVPKGEEDVFNHIAVVPSLEMAQKVRDIGFSQFVLIDHNGAILEIYDND